MDATRAQVNHLEAMHKSTLQRLSSIDQSSKLTGFQMQLVPIKVVCPVRVLAEHSSRLHRIQCRQHFSWADHCGSSSLR